MKILKKIGIFLLVLLAIWVVLALFGPSVVHVERTTVINAEAKTAFDQINTLKNWKTWSYWDNIDKTTMRDTFSGPESGVGAKHGWDSKNDSVGKGSLTITKSEENKFVEFDLYFDGMGTSTGGYKIADTTGGVKVTTYMDMKCGFMMRPMMLFMNMDKMLGPDFEKTLTGLKNACENMPKQVQYEVKEGTVAETIILSVRDTVNSAAEIGPKLGELYEEIGKQLGAAKMAGPVFAIYHSFSNEMIDMEAGIPVSVKVDKTSGRVKAGVIKAGNTVTVDYYGPYEGSEAAHAFLHEWAKKNNKKLGTAPWEIYVTDPGVEKDPNKVLTQIVYYVE